MQTTYTEAQHMTPGAQRMILDCWLNKDHSPESIESVAKYMSKTLRIGGIKTCRALVNHAIANAQQ